MPQELRPLINELRDLHKDMLDLVNENLPMLEQIQHDRRLSATNLLHYLALRRRDVRGLQDQLAGLGLSSLGRTETHVMSGVRAVMRILASLHKLKPSHNPAAEQACDGDEGRRLLERNTELLLGPEPEGRNVRIMVTMPSEAATDYGLVRDLLHRGMNCMRINCAHDGENAWSGMIRNLRQAEQETGKSCKIEMDVAGPKLRTGPIKPGPAVIKVRPTRSELGRIVKPARIWLTPRAKPEASPEHQGACLPVPGRWLATLMPGDRIRFTDTRGAQRFLLITEAAGHSRWAESTHTAYLAPGLTLKAVYKDKTRPRLRARAGQIADRQQTLFLRVGDTLVLTRSLEPGEPGQVATDTDPARPARIGVTLPAFFDCVQPGQPIWFDDGKIGGVVSSVTPDEVTVEIQHARVAGEKLAAEKGINLPETNLITPTLTEDDLQALPFIAKNADLLGYSFVRTDEDVRLLQSHLTELGAHSLGILLKIETRVSFENLPSLLLAAMGSHNVGVMIARGDLAIECGYQRMAEVQEQILWISEAAHVPVVWATQVLESLVKNGTPSRSEITDAAMGVRAECVMLNKGPYIANAVQTLDDILRRMQAHQDKKRSMMRKLDVAARFEGGVPDGPDRPIPQP